MDIHRPIYTVWREHKVIPDQLERAESISYDLYIFISHGRHLQDNIYKWIFLNEYV